jgi:hypothetical protein
VALSPLDMLTAVVPVCSARACSHGAGAGTGTGRYRRSSKHTRQLRAWRGMSERKESYQAYQLAVPHIRSSEMQTFSAVTPPPSPATPEPILSHHTARAAEQLVACQQELCSVAGKPTHVQRPLGPVPQHPPPRSGPSGRRRRGTENSISSAATEWRRQLNALLVRRLQ